MIPPKFDAVAYLAEINPLHQYSTVQLSGGLVNLTYRACKTGSRTAHSQDSSIPGISNQQTIILKYALPYVAAVGEHATLNLRRQQVEARALHLLHQGLLLKEETLSELTKKQKTNTELDVSDETNRPTVIKIPRLLHYDDLAHVLVLEDLGDIPSLSDVFSLFGGWVGDAQPSSGISCARLFAEVNCSGEKSQKLMQRFKHVGCLLGKFFSHLHDNQTAQSLLQLHRSQFENRELKESVQEHSIKPVATMMKRFPQFLLSEEEAEKLVGWALHEAQRAVSDEEVSFVLGDCWSGSVLLNVASMMENLRDSNGDVAVIDWEFSGFGKGAHGDMVQLLAHLELLRISSRQASTSSEFDVAGQCLEALTNELITEYATANRSRGWDTEQAEAFLQRSERTRNTSHVRRMQPPNPSDQRATLMRASFLSHGIESIDCAFGKQWRCFSATCGHGLREVPPEECILVQQIVQSGLWFLRHACEDVIAFCGKDNWHDITSNA